MNALLLIAVALLATVVCCGASTRLAGGVLSLSIACSSAACSAAETSVAPIAKRCTNGVCSTAPPSVSMAAIAKRKPQTLAQAPPAAAFPVAQQAYYAPQCVGGQCRTPQGVFYRFRK